MRIVRVVGRVLSVVSGVLLLAIIGVYVASGRRIRAEYDVPVAQITTSGDSATLELGRHVAETRGCTGCHRSDLSGEDVVNDRLFGRMTARNLTSGRNGAGAVFSDADWVRAIRSGVRPDGSPLLIMPSHEYRPMGPEDLGALVSWIKSVPPVDTEPVDQKVGPLARVLLLTGAAPLLPVELIDHADATFAQPEAAPTVAFGEYLTSVCVGCHGPLFAGGPILGMPPEYPAAGNLTPDVETGIGSWTEADFKAFFATGVRPDGRQVNAAYMPWTMGESLTDTEEEAIWLFLRSLPPREMGAK